MDRNFFSDEQVSTIRNITLEELEEIQERILTLSNGGAYPVPETVSELKDIFHKIKGTAGLAGFDDISRLGEEGEEAFSENSDDAGIATFLEDAIGRLDSLIREARREIDSPD